MEDTQIKEYRLWFTSGLPLETIGGIFADTEIIQQYSYDYENVYEWLIAQTQEENITLNISRKHRDNGDVSAEPITTLILYRLTEPPDRVVEQLARRIANALRISVSVGIVEYLGGDDFRYHEHHQIAPLHA